MNGLYYNFIFIAFGASTSDWAFQMGCGSSTCYQYDSEVLLSPGKTTIFTLFIYGSTTYAYYAAFKSADGSVVGSRYKSNIAWNYVYGSTLVGDTIAATLTCSPTQMFICLYNKTASSFEFKQFSGTSLYGMTLEPSSGR